MSSGPGRPAEFLDLASMRRPHCGVSFLVAVTNCVHRHGFFEVFPSSDAAAESCLFAVSCHLKTWKSQPVCSAEMSSHSLNLWLCTADIENSQNLCSFTLGNIILKIVALFAAALSWSSEPLPILTSERLSLSGCSFYTQTCSSPVAS